MNAWDVIQRLYDGEINAGMQADCNSGIRVWIGGPRNTPGNPILVEVTFSRDEFDQVGAWLDVEARRLFPDSKYTYGPSGP